MNQSVFTEEKESCRILGEFCRARNCESCEISTMCREYLGGIGLSVFVRLMSDALRRTEEARK